MTWCESFVLKQVETVGQVYMAASGAPDRLEDHAMRVADVSQELINSVKTMKLTAQFDLQIRVGMFNDISEEN